MYLGMIIRMRQYGSVARSMFFCLRSERGALEAVQGFTQRCSKNPEPGCVVFSWRSYWPQHISTPMCCGWFSVPNLGGLGYDYIFTWYKWKVYAMSLQNPWKNPWTGGKFFLEMATYRKPLQEYYGLEAALGERPGCSDSLHATEVLGAVEGADDGLVVVCS